MSRSSCIFLQRLFEEGKARSQSIQINFSRHSRKQENQRLLNLQQVCSHRCLYTSKYHLGLFLSNRYIAHLLFVIRIFSKGICCCSKVSCRLLQNLNHNLVLLCYKFLSNGCVSCTGLTSFPWIRLLVSPILRFWTMLFFVCCSIEMLRRVEITYRKT